MKLTVVIYAQGTGNEHLEKTLKSVCGSTLNDYEVLLLNDGSEKDYTELVSKYGIRYVKTEKRGALASRLYAIEIANGEYIAFVNAAERVTFNYHMPMLERAYEADADVVINDIAYEVNGVKAVSRAECEKSYELENEAILNELVADHARTYAYYSIYNKIFKRAVLKKMKAELEETSIIMHKLACKEDILLSIYAFKNAKKLSTVHTGYYILNVDSCTVCVSGELDDVRTMFKKGVGYLNVGLVKETFAQALILCAKLQKQKEKIEPIEKALAYGKLKPLSKKEAQMYLKLEYLGDNFDDIDKALKKISDTESSYTVMYDMANTYAKNTLDYIQTHQNQTVGGKQITLMVPKKIAKKKIKLSAPELLAKIML